MEAPALNGSAQVDNTISAPGPSGPAHTTLTADASNHSNADMHLNGVSTDDSASTMTTGANPKDPKKGTVKEEADALSMSRSADPEKGEIKKEDEAQNMCSLMYISLVTIAIAVSLF